MLVQQDFRLRGGPFRNVVAELLYEEKKGPQEALLLWDQCDDHAALYRMIGGRFLFDTLVQVPKQ